MKLSNNFDLKELVPKDVYQNWGTESILFIDGRIINVVQRIREISGCVITINDWHLGGDLQFRGLRPWNCTTGALSSQHKFGRAVDFSSSFMTTLSFRDLISAHQSELRLLGLTRIELNTPNWVHIDCAWTGIEDITFF